MAVTGVVLIALSSATWSATSRSSRIRTGSTATPTSCSRSGRRSGSCARCCWPASASTSGRRRRWRSRTGGPGPGALPGEHVAPGHLRLALHALDRLRRPGLHPLSPGPVHAGGGPDRHFQDPPPALHDDGRLPIIGLTVVRAGTEVLDVRRMVIRGFQNPVVAVFYIVAVGLLSLHLLHGAESLFQTLGWRNERWARGLRTVVTLGCAAYFLGNLAIPGAVLAGMLQPRLPRLNGRRVETLIPPAMAQLDSKIPPGPLAEKWRRHKADIKLVNPANKRKYEVIVVGAGLAGASAAATLAELGYRVKCFVFHDSPRRAHSIAAQGGINAAKNYQNDGDSVYRLFYDTIKGGDYRSREANIHRLAEVSVNIIDQCVAQGVPFAREYGGLLANRSFGGAQVSRTFYARGQTGQQLLLGAYSALSRMVGAGGVQLCTPSEMLDLVVVDGHAKGIVVRDLVTGEITRHAADAVVLATGGYGNVFNLSTYARGSNATAIWRAYKRGACFANPCFTQIHPTCIPVSGRLPVEADADVGVAPQRRPHLGAEEQGGPAEGPGRNPRGGPRLLPGADVPGLRQPLPARRRLARGQARLRRGPRGGRERPRRLPRFRGRDRPPGRGGRARALRQPLRHLPRDHQRERLPGADADLPGGPLHDGRPLGGLQPHVQRPRALRPRRGELLRPRREPPRRLRPDAGPGRRLLRDPVHDRRLPGDAEAGLAAGAGRGGVPRRPRRRFGGGSPGCSGRRAGSP